MIATIERNEKRPVGRILDFSGEYGVSPLERLADVFLLGNNVVSHHHPNVEKNGNNINMNNINNNNDQVKNNRILRFLVEFGNDDRDDVFSPVALAATWAV